MKKKFYFKNEGDEICYTEEKILADMKSDGIDELTVLEAYPYKASGGIFWCKHDCFCGDDSYEYCGKDNCRNYTPRNGKSGCCKYYTTIMYGTGDEVTLKVEG